MAECRRPSEIGGLILMTVRPDEITATPDVARVYHLLLECGVRPDIYRPVFVRH